MPSDDWMLEYAKEQLAKELTASNAVHYMPYKKKEKQPKPIFEKEEKPKEEKKKS